MLLERTNAQTGPRLISQLESDGGRVEDKTLANVGHDVGIEGGNVEVDRCSRLREARVELWGRGSRRRLECDRGARAETSKARAKGCVGRFNDSTESQA